MRSLTFTASYLTAVYDLDVAPPYLDRASLLRVNSNVELRRFDYKSCGNVDIIADPFPCISHHFWTISRPYTPSRTRRVTYGTHSAHACGMRIGMHMHMHMRWCSDSQQNRNLVRHPRFFNITEHAGYSGLGLDSDFDHDFFCNPRCHTAPHTPCGIFVSVPMRVLTDCT